MIRWVKFICILLISCDMAAQVDTLTWETLADVTWMEEYDESTGVTELSGEFGKDLLAYKDREVIISGYVIPLDAMGLAYALSKTNFAACFFCGQSGPETVMDLKVRPRSIPPHEQKETRLTFRGILRLKEINPTGLHYTLDSAQEMK